MPKAIAALLVAAGIPGMVWAAPPAKPASKPPTELLAGLKWLSQSQRADGSWQTGMGANQQAIVVTTSFAALALMASGRPQYQRQVDAAAVFVAANLFQGLALIQLPPNLDQSNWKIAIGGYFLCEYYAYLRRNNPRYRSARLEAVLKKAVEESLKRMEESGGWGHTPRIPCPLNYVEMEVMSYWMLATLGACQRLGLKVPADKLKKPLEYIEQCCNEGKGEVGYSHRSGQKGFGCVCRTGGTLFAFALLKQREHPLYPLMRDYWKATMNESDGGHGSVSLGLLASALGARQLGQEEWASFKEQFFPKVLKLAEKNGSFRPVEGTKFQSKGAADAMVGPAYNTAICAVILQLEGGQLRLMCRKLD